MSKIFNGTRDKEMEFTASKKLDDGRRKKDPDGSMTFISFNFGVTGNRLGKNKTANENSGTSTGGSYQGLFGSDYSVAGLTIPISWKYGKEHTNEIMGEIASIQTKFSQNLTEIQGQLTAEQEKELRESAKRSQAVREAKEEIRSNGDDDFDQKAFDKANSGVRASVVSDMSLSAGIECTAAVGINSEEAKSARDRGWKTSKNDSGILSTRNKEKGLKSVYLMDIDRVKKAQDYVYEIGSQMQKLVDDNLKSGWSDEISMNILRGVNSIVKETSSKKIKVVPDYTADEIAEIAAFKKEIINNYDSIMNSFE